MDPQEFLFVNFTREKRGRDRQMKKIVQTHVMKDIGKRRRRKRNPQFELDMRYTWPSAPLERAYSVQGSPQTSPLLALNEVSRVARVRPRKLLDESDHKGYFPPVFGPPRPFWNQNPFQILSDGWGMDPFAAYSLALALFGNMNGHDLLSGRNYLPQRTQVFWFPFARVNSQSFRDLLFSPQIHGAVMQDLKTGLAICLGRYTQVLSCIRSSIATASPSSGFKAHIAVAIIGLICYNYVCQDFVQADIHFRGLREILALGSSDDSLPAQLRLMVMWIDVTAALIQSSVPKFPLPTGLLPILPPPPQPANPLQMQHLVEGMLKVSPELADIMDVYQDLKTLAALIEEQSSVTSGNAWKDELFISSHLNAIAHRLLSLSPSSVSPSSFPEICRIAALLLVISIKRTFNSFPGDLPPYSNTIIDTLSALGETRPEFLELRLWLLTVAGITSTTCEEQDIVEGMIVEEMRLADLSTWDELMERVKIMPWFRGLWHEESILLGEKVMRKMDFNTIKS